MNIKTVYLDLDDTLVDLQGPLFDLLGIPHSRISELETYKDSLPLISGLSREEIVEKWANAGAEFWEELEWTEFGKEIWNLSHVSKYGYKRGLDVMIVTALPANSSPKFRQVTAIGKLLWFEKHFGEDFTSFALCNDKGILGGPDRLLVDDRNDYVEKFRSRGGVAIQIPQPWNDSLSSTKEILDYIEAYLDEGSSSLPIPPYVGSDFFGEF